MTATYNPAGSITIAPVRSPQMAPGSLQYLSDLAHRIGDTFRSLASGLDCGAIDRHAVYQELVDLGYDEADLSALTMGMRLDTQGPR